jgi:hypothetical protein
MVECGTSGFADSFHTDLYGEILVEEITAVHLTVQDTGRTFRIEHLAFLH